jgi:hypothetical protein
MSKLQQKMLNDWSLLAVLQRNYLIAALNLTRIEDEGFGKNSSTTAIGFVSFHDRACSVRSRSE